jgi:hypothetical protein
MSNVLAGFGMRKSNADCCLFLKDLDDGTTLKVMVHVNNIYILGPSSQRVPLQTHMDSHFKKVTYCYDAVNLGLEINIEAHATHSFFRNKVSFAS